MLRHSGNGTFLRARLETGTLSPARGTELLCQKHFPWDLPVRAVAFPSPT